MLQNAVSSTSITNHVSWSTGVTHSKITGTLQRHRSPPKDKLLRERRSCSTIFTGTAFPRVPAPLHPWCRVLQLLPTHYPGLERVTCWSINLPQLRCLQELPEHQSIVSALLLTSSCLSCRNASAACLAAALILHERLHFYGRRRRMGEGILNLVYADEYTSAFMRDYLIGDVLRVAWPLKSFGNNSYWYLGMTWKRYKK